MTVNRKAALSLTAIAIAVFMVTLFCPTTGAWAGAKEYHWKIAHIRPEGSPIDKDLRAFAEKIKERSNGRIIIDVYPANQLGDYTVVQERISVGAVEMACQCLSTAKDKRLLIQYMPYLARNWDEAKKIFASNSPLIKSINEMMKKEDIKIIATYPVYFGGIATTKKVTDPEKMHANKKTKIRVPTIKSFSLLADEWGYMGTPLAWADIFTSLQTGVVDGAIGSGAEGIYATLRDLIKYYYVVNDHFENWFLIINNETWEDLSPEDQKLIEASATEMQDKRFEIAESQEQEYIQKLRDHGVEVVTFTPEQLSLFAEETRKNIWPQLKDEIGEELIESSLNSLK